MKTIEGTGIKIVDVLSCSKITYSKETSLGMCHAILNTLWKRNIYSMSEQECIPLFNKRMAIEMFGANPNGNFWWLISDTDIRIKYFDWLIEQYNL